MAAAIRVTAAARVKAEDRVALAKARMVTRNGTVHAEVRLAVSSLSRAGCFGTPMHHTLIAESSPHPRVWHMQDKVAERAFYEDLFEKDMRNVHITYGYDELYDKVFPKRASGELLDLGCGTGAHAIRLAQRGFDVTAVDITWRGVVAARDRFRAMGLSVDVVVADAEHLPFKTSSFDVIWTALLLHHFPKLDQLPGELARVSRREVVALEPNAGNFLTWFAFNIINPIWGISSTTKNQRALWPRALHKEFDKVGFRVRVFEFVHRAWTDSESGVRTIRRIADGILGLLPLRYRANKFIVTYERAATG